MRKPKVATGVEFSVWQRVVPQDTSYCTHEFQMPIPIYFTREREREKEGERVREKEKEREKIYISPSDSIHKVIKTLKILKSPPFSHRRRAPKSPFLYKQKENGPESHFSIQTSIPIILSSFTYTLLNKHYYYYYYYYYYK